MLTTFLEQHGVESTILLEGELCRETVVKDLSESREALASQEDAAACFCGCDGKG